MADPIITSSAPGSTHDGKIGVSARGSVFRTIHNDRDINSILVLDTEIETFAGLHRDQQQWAAACSAIATWLLTYIADKYSNEAEAITQRSWLIIFVASGFLIVSIYKYNQYGWRRDDLLERLHNNNPNPKVLRYAYRVCKSKIIKWLKKWDDPDPEGGQ